MLSTGAKSLLDLVYKWIENSDLPLLHTELTRQFSDLISEFRFQFLKDRASSEDIF
jgi:hypothetical protein